MDENREAAKEFGEALRAKLAASRQGLRLEDLTGQERSGDESTDVERRDEPESGG